MQYATYAQTASSGREFEEAPPTYRSEFQRDRDRIIHSSAFRRLEYKTQVFINHEGDLFRTRLTHSLEVAQIGRSIASALNLNIDLVEAICLAHDLGHTPFGHSGQDILNQCLSPYNKHFEHNLQSLRIVRHLEERYPLFNGLNLTFETLTGILKHCPLNVAKQLGHLGLRFINNTNPSLEAQLADISDELAYIFHDLDDGLRAGLLNLEDLTTEPLIKEHLDIIYQQYSFLSGRRLHKELVRFLINTTIYQLIDSSKANLLKYQINTLKEVYLAPKIIDYTPEFHTKLHSLKKYLYKNLYNHYTVIQLRYKVEKVVRELFNAFISCPSLLPNDYQARINNSSLARVVADYISGMTDRYAFRLYNRLFNIESL